MCSAWPSDIIPVLRPSTCRENKPSALLCFEEAVGVVSFQNAPYKELNFRTSFISSTLSSGATEVPIVDWLCRLAFCPDCPKKLLAL